MPPRAPCWARSFGGGLLLLAVLVVSGGSAGAGNSTSSHGAATVHMVWSNHLDIGFDNIEPLIGYDNNVINKYFWEYFPRAMRLAAAMRRHADGADAFAYTTHSWLLSLYLDCPPAMGVRCPGPGEVAAMTGAMRRGDILWHAHPHNAQWEVYDPSLFQFSFNLTHSLDDWLGLPRKRTAILRDVPGVTRAALPLMAGSGVSALSVGVNPGSAPPGVPKCTPFWWRDEASGTQVLAWWHPGGYGGMQPNITLDTPADCITAPGLDHVLCTSWRPDNSGPPEDVGEVLLAYRLLREQWPGARIVASSFDAFTAAVDAAAPRLELPTVTEEIGDTWVFGIGSDPAKVATFRAALRARTACIADPRCDDQAPAFFNFSRLLLKIPEHTWGLDVKKTLADFDNYTNARFHPCLRRPLCPNYAILVHAWQRQAAYVTWALEALPEGHTVRRATAEDASARSALAAVGEEELMLHGAVRVVIEPGHSYSFRSRYWDLAVDADTGGLVRLARRYAHGTGNDWAGGAAAAFAQLQYDVYNETSYDVIWSSYAYRLPMEWWFPMVGADCETLPPPTRLECSEDFGKYNLSNVWRKQAQTVARLEALWHSSRPDGVLALDLRLSFPEWLVRDAGAPASAWLRLSATADSPLLRLALVWQRKTPTRLPEALWLRVRPAAGAVDPTTWRLHKLGAAIDPSGVCVNGSQSMHAVGEEGASVASADGRELLSWRTLDSPLVSPGRPTVFPIGFQPPDMEQGISFNLVNNVWGTNYVMWTPQLHDEGEGVNFTCRWEVNAALTAGDSPPPTRAHTEQL